MSSVSILLFQNLQKKEVEAAVMDQSTIIACIITGVIAFLVGGALCFFVGVQYRRKVAEAELGSAEEEAKRILSDAIKSAGKFGKKGWNSAAKD